MRNKLILLFALLMIGGIRSSKFTNAEDFNFTVPVQVNNLLPEVSVIEVKCRVFSEGWNLSIGDDYSSRVPVPDSGNLSTSVNVKFNARPDRDPNDAKEYVCNLKVDEKNVPNNDYIIAQPKPGTAVVGEVTGDIQ